ncbi:hypothetical protein ACQR1W_01885 [Bradyrhizobium sp. HKCCYLS1011]|uniref:hypothetical protein n=1 Tax=Bradyrhizobium sp. HKCCYLS1011 TaxID=3420733 RepID=UPI003EB8C5A2
MASYDEIYRQAMAGYRSAIVEQQAAFERATLAGDVDEQIRASQELAALRVQANEYHAMCVQHAETMRPAPQASKYGLSEQEREVAHNWTSDASLSNDERERIYAEQRAKYRQMRADGSYRDDQGMVRR